jgi:hypothetical protein
MVPLSFSPIPIFQKLTLVHWYSDLENVHHSVKSLQELTCLQAMYRLEDVIGFAGLAKVSGCIKYHNGN